MSCPGCGNEAPPGSAFCNACGAKLGSPSASSAPAVRVPLDYTPKHLVDKILRSKTALEGERKQVTVLFADVKSSMELAEQVDPERWHDILNGFFSLLAEGVHRFEGTINQFTGDGIMALFGAPIAHEDHAQRGCYAALRLRDRLHDYADELRRSHGLNFSVRMGLNSGEVIVGTIGDDLRMDYTAQGHTVGLAARVEQLAAADRVYLTEQSVRLVEGYFELRDLGPFTLKGAKQPVRVFELCAPGVLGTRLAASQARGFSRFVGRTTETQILETALERAREGRGQVVGIVGEAGVGKSRLCFEFVERCRTKGVPVYEAHCPAHGKTVPFLATLQLMRAYYGISERDTPAEARAKVAGTLILIDPRFHESLALVFDFLGISDPDHPLPRMDRETRQQRLIGLVREMGRARAMRETSITLVDDLHWIDPGSNVFVGHLVEAMTGTRGLMLVNFRPEYEAAWMHRSDYQQIPLTPLGPEAVDDLMASLLGDDVSLSPIKELVSSRANGNPFFVEELIQMLIEEDRVEGELGVYRMVGRDRSSSVPATVQSVLAARIDRLDPAAKAVLQAAAVIGREFNKLILEQVCEQHRDVLDGTLDVLGRTEFIFTRSLYPETEYSFKHPLTQEVAYSLQLGARRSRLHECVAKAIEKLQPEKQRENAALLAHHWEAAGNPLEAARWHKHAGVWTALTNAVESIRHWGKVRELLADLPDSPRTNHWRAVACSQILNLGWRQGGMPPDEARRLFEEGAQFAHEDPGMLALVHIAYGTVLGTLGRSREWIELGYRGLELAEQTGSEILEVVVLATLAPAFATTGDYGRAIEVAERGMALADGSPDMGAQFMDFSPYLLLLSGGGFSHLYLGDLDEGVESIGRALRLAHERDDVLVQAWANAWLIDWAYLSGETDGALARGRAAVEFAERVGSPGLLTTTYAYLGLGAFLEGDLVQASEVLEHAQQVRHEKFDTSHTEISTLSILAQVYAASGRLDAARTTLEEATEKAQRLGTHRFDTSIELARADLLLKSGGRDEHESIRLALDRAEECASEFELRALRPLIGIERAHLAARIGDDSGRMRALREALRIAQAIGATGHARHIAQALGRLDTW
ncbi:MAG: adenylate/guanylate cyclase domain-containing protein [Myxococcota bacterium]